MIAPDLQWVAATRDPGFVQRVLAIKAHFAAALSGARAGRELDAPTLTGLDKAIASLNALATTSIQQARATQNAEAAASLQAKAALAQTVAAELAAAAHPAATLAGWIADRLAAAELDPTHPATDADAAASELAADLCAADSQARQEAFATRWSVPGLLRVLHHVPEPHRITIAADIVFAAQADRPYLHDLCTAAIEAAAQAAAEPVDILAPEGVAAALTSVVGSTGATAAYADDLAAAAGTGDVLAHVLDHPAPAELARLTAALHDYALIRFGQWVALSVARGHVLLRVLAPALTDSQAARLAAACDDPADPARAAADTYVGQLVAAGRWADTLVQGGEDPDDLVVQRGAVLDDAFALAAAFAAPSPEDPLGTLPALRVTRLGQAILQARTHRPRDYDWRAVALLRENDPGSFLTLVQDERCEVLDLIPLPPS